MTLATTSSRVDYTGNGVSTAFAVPFAFFDAAELRVIERVITTGVEAVLALGTHYTVSGGAGVAGTVTAVTAPAATRRWTILRATRRTQEVDYQPNDPFPAETHERALDRAMAVAQEIERDNARAVRVAETDATAPVLPNSTARAGRYLAFDANGDPVPAAGTAGPPISPFASTLLDDADAAAARATLGASTTGGALFTAADAAAARTALGASATGGALFTAADAAAGRVAIAAAPLPQSAVGVGQMVGINSGSGSALTLPVNGSWAWWYRGINNGTGAGTGVEAVGVGTAGGTTIQGGTAGIVYAGWAWRIA